MQFSRRGFLLSVRFLTLSKVFCCCGALCQKTSAKVWLTELNQSHRIYALDKLARGWDVPQFHSETDRTITTFQPPCPRCGMPMWLVRIAKFDATHDLRTFECKVCEHTENKVVEFKATP